jgi:hypothetical protein
LKQLRTDPAVSNSYAFGEYMHVTFKDGNINETYLKELAAKYGATDVEVKKITPSIEDCFIRLMRENETAVTNLNEKLQ